MFARVIALFVLVLLGGCAVAPMDLPERAQAGDPVLAPFEDVASIPPQIALLPFEPGRAYAILVQIPAPAVVDLSDPGRARRGLAQFLNPFATLRAGTLLGHTMAGWRCRDGTMGLVSKSGDDDNIGLRMVFRGWGLAAFLSEFHDGHLYEASQISSRHRRVLREGRARIVAVEIPETGCQSMRRALIRYRTHPNHPETVFTMMRDPARMQGDGCAEFAMWLLGQGGAYRGLVPALRRQLVLRDSFIGRGSAMDGPVAPYTAPGAVERMPLLRLLSDDWTQGDAVGTVTILDLELLRVVIDQAYGRIAPTPPRLRDDDRQAARVARAARRWFARYRRTTPVRIGPARAVILSRG